ncbi:MAG: hypothetical protein ACYTFY_18450 [Planctomycetota bacterium]|jgi:hypothetical protein
MIKSIQKLTTTADDNILTISAESEKKYTIVEFIHKDNLRNVKQLESEWIRVISFIRTPNMIVDFSSARIIPSMALAVTIRMIGKLNNHKLNVYFFCPDNQIKKALDTIGNTIPVYTDLFKILKDLRSLNTSSKRWLSRHGRQKALKKLKKRFLKEKHPSKRRVEFVSKKNFASIFFLLLSAIFCTWQLASKNTDTDNNSGLKTILENLPHTYAEEFTNEVVVLTGPHEIPLKQRTKTFWKAYRCENKRCPGRREGEKYIFPHILKAKDADDIENYDETTPLECPLCKNKRQFCHNVKRYWTAAALKKLKEIRE